MKYQDRDELVADLRELADFLEWKGHKLPISLWYPVSLRQSFWDSDDTPPIESMRRVARNIGKADKQFTEGGYKLVRKMSNGQVQLIFETPRENVCVKKVVGTKKEQKRVFVDIPGEFVEKEIVEWVCDEPLLSTKD